MTNKKKTLRDTGREITREAILEAARSELLRRGFHRTTVRGIASKARVAVGSVMAHFGSKETLLYEVFYEDLEQVVEKIQAAPPSSEVLSEQLLTTSDAFFTLYRSEPDLYCALLERALFTGGEWGLKFESQVARFGVQIASLFQHAIERGEIDPGLDIRAEVATFLSFYYFVLIQQLKVRFQEISAGRSMLCTLVSNHLERLKI